MKQILDKVNEIAEVLNSEHGVPNVEWVKNNVNELQEVVKEKLVRMTIDTPESMHKALKIKSIERGISLRDYILRLIEKELK